MSLARGSAPAPLTVAASLAAVEGTVLLMLAVLELATLDGSRLTMGLTTTVFFLLYGVGLAVCGAFLSRGSSWARSPVVLAQLIQLGLAWSFRADPTTWIAVSLAVVAAVVLAGVFHPASLAALSEE